jgi:hypothetical protein
MRILLCLFIVLVGSSILLGEDVERGIAAGFSADAGIENHPAVMFASGFENGFDGWTLSARDRTISSIVDDPAIVHTGKKCCISVALKGKNEGGNVTWRFPEPVDQIYLRFYCRFDKDSVTPHHFVKIRALREGWNARAGLAPPGDKGFWTGIEPSRSGSWHFYTYWHQMRSGRANPTGAKGDYYGNIFTMPGQTPLEREKWICVEAMMKANTVGKSDGELAFWIEGQLIGWWKPGSPAGTWNRSRFLVPGDDPKPFEGFNFRTDPTLRINQVALQWYVSHGHAARGAAERNLVYFDDVVVAKDYIGPMNLGKSAAARFPSPASSAPNR